jgi:hypothetical protein
MPAITRDEASQIIDALRLETLPVEGGLFIQTWKSQSESAIHGTAILAAFTDDPDSFSAMHKLPVDEIWHFYLGDPLGMVLLHPDGSWSAPVLGPDVLGGQRPQLVVPAGTWMGARLRPGGVFVLFGCTMAPGFQSDSYVGGERDDLADRWPEVADEISSLTRPDHPLRMPDGL